MPHRLIARLLFVGVLVAFMFLFAQTNSVAARIVGAAVIVAALGCVIALADRSGR